MMSKKDDGQLARRDLSVRSKSLKNANKLPESGPEKPKNLPFGPS